jgi:hypothetical protein
VLASRCPTTSTSSPAFVALGIFLKQSYFYAKPAWTLILLFYDSPCHWDDRLMLRFFFLEMGSQNIFPRLPWNHNSFLISASQIVGITGMSHWHPAAESFLSALCLPPMCKFLDNLTDFTLKLCPEACHFS